MRRGNNGKGIKMKMLSLKTVWVSLFVTFMLVGSTVAQETGPENFLIEAYVIETYEDALAEAGYDPISDQPKDISPMMLAWCLAKDEAQIIASARAAAAENEAAEWTSNIRSYITAYYQNDRQSKVVPYETVINLHAIPRLLENQMTRLELHFEISKPIFDYEDMDRDHDDQIDTNKLHGAGPYLETSLNLKCNTILDLKPNTIRIAASVQKDDQMYFLIINVDRLN